MEDERYIILSWFCVKTLMICFEIQSLKKELFKMFLKRLVSDICQISVRRL